MWLGFGAGVVAGVLDSMLGTSMLGTSMTRSHRQQCIICHSLTMLTV